MPRNMPEMDFTSIIEAAIKIEEQSYSLYKMAKEKVDRQASKKFLAELMEEELKHKTKLLAVLKNKEKLSNLGLSSRKIEDLKIVDQIKDTQLTKDADYQRILVYAAKREKVTYDYYSSLAQGLEGKELGQLFLKLAQEELKHKNKLEKEYDEYILLGN